jgi:hypothetical protein
MILQQEKVLFLSMSNGKQQANAHFLRLPDGNLALIQGWSINPTLNLRQLCQHRSTKFSPTLQTAPPQ